MLTKLETMKLKAELLRIHSARAEMEYQIASKQAEIERLESHVLKQIEAEELLKQKLGE